VSVSTEHAHKQQDCKQVSVRDTFLYNKCLQVESTACYLGVVMSTGENNHIALTGTNMRCRLEADNSSHVREGHESLVRRWKMIQPASGKRGKRKKMFLI